MVTISNLLYLVPVKLIQYIYIFNDMADKCTVCARGCKIVVYPIGTKHPMELNKCLILT